MCVVVQKFVRIGRTIADVLRFDGFQNCVRPPSWISSTRIWATHEEYLAVFWVVQNFVGLDAVVSKPQRGAERVAVARVCWDVQVWAKTSRRWQVITESLL